MEKKARDELTMEKQSKLKRGADAQYGVPETLRGREWIANSVRAIPYPLEHNLVAGNPSGP